MTRYDSAWAVFYIPLGEKAQRQQNDESVAVSLGLDELEPAVALELLLELDGILDLLQLELHDLRVAIAVGMDLCEDIVSLLNLAMGNEIAWALRHEPDKRHLQD